MFLKVRTSGVPVAQQSPLIIASNHMCVAPSNAASDLRTQHRF